jgi:hypothetical protein
MIESMRGRPGGQADWRREVLAANRNRCSNCGGVDRLAVLMVVPEDAGGKFLLSNGVVLCRTCEMAADTVRGRKPEESRRPLNFWVSRKLYDSIQLHLTKQEGFNSMGGLVRYLISKFVNDEPRFDDLEQYQDSGTDVKINVWVDMDGYGRFKALLDKRGTTVTDAIKGLIRMYECSAEPVVRRNTNA